MDWQEIEVSTSRNNFIYKGQIIFAEDFLDVLEFQNPGIAAVKKSEGWHHISIDGKAIYSKFYERVFGFYFDRAVVNEKNFAYHIGIDGLAAYKERYLWCGNYQEGICIVKEFKNKYFHINKNGERIYAKDYIYAGDFKEGIACVCLDNGHYTHIKLDGTFLHNKNFELLDVYHKGFARAKDNDGWFHVDRNGNEVYSTRYSLIEPFYNGYAFCVTLSGGKIILNERGEEIKLHREISEV